MIMTNSKRIQKTKKNRNQNPLKSEMPSLLSEIQWKTAGRSKNATTGHVFILGLDDKNQIFQLIEKYAQEWQQQTLKSNEQKELLHFSGPLGPVWIYCRRKAKGPFSHHARLEDSDYSWHRDQFGSILGFSKSYQLKHVNVEFMSTDEEQELGAFVGLELAAYQYKNMIGGKSTGEAPRFSFSKSGGEFHKKILTEAMTLGRAINWARHLVNTPPNELNPTTMIEFVKRNFKNSSRMKVEIWNHTRLSKEKMGLHLAVGQGSAHPPCMIHFKYRPPRQTKKKPIAFVGKGITFDTGGLDIKPSSAMRLMKKDMGGVAGLVGLAFWIQDSQLQIPVDIYLGLAENSVDGLSMRPSDVYRSRQGLNVEIHNTDAEGRLVLADVLTVATTKKGSDEPQSVIDVATLTGAIKVGLGADIAGLFSNHDGLAEELNRAGTQRGELNWRMPLFSKYTRGMETPFADLVNTVDGFAGAITAALFLEKFVNGKPWAHLDIYSWNDRPSGALTFSGGNGQPVQTLVQYLLMKENED